MIKKLINGVTVMFLLLLLSSCATTSNKWPYKKDGISLNISSGKVLNIYSGHNHDLTLGILQTSGTSKYSNLLKTKKGLSYLLSNSMKTNSETGFTRIYIEPNSSNKAIMIDREKNTQYVYLIFGYANGSEEDDSQIIPIPIGESADTLIINMKLGSNTPVSLEYQEHKSFVDWVKNIF